MSKFHTGIYIFFLISLAILGYLAHRLPYFPGDIAVSLWLQKIDLSFVNPVMQAVSYISSLIPAIFIVILVAGGLWLLKKKAEAPFIVSLASLTALANWLLKLLISRPRPDSELIQVLGESSGFSFPSGHTAYAVVFYGFLFYLVPRLTRQAAIRRALQSILTLLVMLTGASRIYLGAHWPSDTLASLLLGGLLLATAIALHHNYAEGNQRRLGDINA